ncbi:hypothetical protein AB0D54_26300 [Streptomyces xanthophaeus]|uniref:hypothetical protein n=1 Tax=Streptomyces xanthophaeus TaxID=67385 RepID=UPI00343EEE72
MSTQFQEKGFHQEKCGISATIMCRATSYVEAYGVHAPLSSSKVDTPYDGGASGPAPAGGAGTGNSRVSSL